MGSTPAPLALHMSHKHVYNHTETSRERADLSEGAIMYEVKERMNILGSLKRTREAPSSDIAGL